MSNPTTPFGWQMPTAVDLVTDLPADFEVFGQAVATSMGDLLGGTTGQILSKASNADMDFAWTATNPGDITGVTAGVGISGGGTSGDVTVTNSMATAITTNGDLIYGTGAGTFSRLGAGSTGQGLSVVAGIPAWTASAQSTLTTTGDMLYASAANTLARRAVGTTGQVLTVAGGVPTWTTPAAAGSLTLIATASPSAASGFSFTSIPSTYQNLVIVGSTTQTGTNAFYYGNLVTFNNDSNYNYNWFATANRNGIAPTTRGLNTSSIGQGFDWFSVIPSQDAGTTDVTSYSSIFTIYNYAGSVKKNYSYLSTGRYGSADPMNIYGSGNYTNSTAISSIEFVAGGTNLLTGTIQLWGQK